jgi:hypothetical protein
MPAWMRCTWHWWVVLPPPLAAHQPGCMLPGCCPAAGSSGTARRQATHVEERRQVVVAVLAPAHHPQEQVDLRGAGRGARGGVGSSGRGCRSGSSPCQQQAATGLPGAPTLEGEKSGSVCVLLARAATRRGAARLAGAAPEKGALLAGAARIAAPCAAAAMAWLPVCAARVALALASTQRRVVLWQLGGAPQQRNRWGGLECRAAVARCEAAAQMREWGRGSGSEQRGCRARRRDGAARFAGVAGAQRAGGRGASCRTACAVLIVAATVQMREPAPARKSRDPSSAAGPARGRDDPARGGISHTRCPNYACTGAQRTPQDNPARPLPASPASPRPTSRRVLVAGRRRRWRSQSGPLPRAAGRYAPDRQRRRSPSRCAAAPRGRWAQVRRAAPGARPGHRPSCPPVPSHSHAHTHRSCRARRAAGRRRGHQQPRLHVWQC